MPLSVAKELCSLFLDSGTYIPSTVAPPPIADGKRSFFLGSDIPREPQQKIKQKTQDETKRLKKGHEVLACYEAQTVPILGSLLLKSAANF